MKSFFAQGRTSIGNLRFGKVGTNFLSKHAIKSRCEQNVNFCSGRESVSRFEINKIQREKQPESQSIFLY